MSILPAIIAALLVLSAARSYATDNVVVFYLDKNYRPVVRLDRLPKISESLKAILALYALQNGGGCGGRGEGGLRCELTNALGLSAQCSAEHLKVIRKWFTVIPPLSSRWIAKWNEDPQRPGSLEDLCYAQPDTATWQNNWEIIRVSTSGDTVTVNAIMYWASPNGSGRVRYKTVYQHERNIIKIISNQKTSLGESSKVFPD